MVHAVEVEIERNYAAFLDMRAALMRDNFEKYALLSNRKLEGIFDTPADAALAGFKKFGRHSYSIQLITDEPVDLGFHSHAPSAGQA